LVFSPKRQSGYQVEKRKKKKTESPSLSNHPISIPCESTIRPFNPITFTKLTHNPGWRPANDTPTGHHHPRRHNRTIKHVCKVLQNGHAPDDDIFPYVDVITHRRSLHDCPLPNEYVIPNLEGVEGVNATVQARRRAQNGLF
jgi:hypothetical protein